MKTIWKFQLSIEDIVSLEMPKGARVLHFGTQGLNPVLWVLVDPSATVESRRFRIVGTGHEINDEDTLSYIGTVMCLQGLVFHLFEAG